MFDAQQAEVAASPAPLSYAQVAGPADEPTTKPRASAAQDCAPSSDDEVVVCGSRNSEQFRLRPLPPLPKLKSFLSRPLQVQIAPGVTFGFLEGGFGLRAEFGPGKKSGEADADR